MKKNTKIKEIINKKELKELNMLFLSKKKDLYVVGGSVRDAILGRELKDIDLTTNAHPEEIEEIVDKWSDKTWKIGAMYGTISVKKNNYQMEITTYRKEIYRKESRKPEVKFSKSLKEDLIRRDFTFNSIAVELTSGEIIDPYNGIEDIEKKIIKTPGNTNKSFSDDPLRMIRACRFTSTLLFEPKKEVIDAITKSKERIKSVSIERGREEL